MLFHFESFLTEHINNLYGKITFIVFVLNIVFDKYLRLKIFKLFLLLTFFLFVFDSLFKFQRLLTFF